MNFYKMNEKNVTNMTSAGDLFNLNNSYETLKLWPNKILIIVYMIVFFVGLFGNIVVIYFVLFYRRMQSMTNKFITNLALSDLLVIFICIPDEISRLMETHRSYGKFFCKITHFVQGSLASFVLI